MLQLAISLDETFRKIFVIYSSHFSWVVHTQNDFFCKGDDPNDAAPNEL